MSPRSNGASTTVSRNAVLILAVLVTALLFGCSKTDDASTTTTTTSSGVTTTTKAAGGSTTTANAASTPGKVSISSFAFKPGSQSAKVGDKVTWTNEDAATHTVESDSGTTIKSENLGKGATYAVTFDKAGTYPYHCSIHAQMKATVVVS